MFFNRNGGGINWILVGLGNPGSQYESTRHNMGFLAVDKLAETQKFSFNKLRFKAWTGTFQSGDNKVLVMKPQTYMNLSGESVAPLVRYSNATPADLVVVQDDIDLPLGRMRVRKGGTCGGHNGIRNIIERLGTMQFTRLKLGVGKDKSDVIAHVLGKFDPASRKIMNEVVATSVKAVESILKDGPDRAMNEYNGYNAQV